MNKLNQSQIERICEQQLFHLPYFRGMLRAVEQSFYEQLELAEPIYDLGAGDGHFAWALFDDEQVFGLDPWWEPLLESKARQVYPLLVQAEGAKVPVKNEAFGSAISNSVLEHVDGIQPVLNEVARILKPGGVFYFTVPNEKFRTNLWGMKLLQKLGLKRLAGWYSRFFNKISRHINLDPPEIWLERLQKAGFGQVDYVHYYSDTNLHSLERGHLAGLPNLLWKKLFGRWVLVPSRRNPFIPFQKTVKLVQNPLDEQGCCTFYIAKRLE